MERGEGPEILEPSGAKTAVWQGQINSCFASLHGIEQPRCEQIGESTRRHRPVLHWQNVNRFFGNDFSPAIALLDRNQFFHRRSERGELIRFADIGPIGFGRCGEKRMKREAKQRDRQRRSHHNRPESEKHAEKRTATDRS